MFYIGLAKAKSKPNKESVEQAAKVIEDLKSKGIKILGWYWTLGCYDYVLIFEAENEKEALKVSLASGDLLTSETLTAIPREEAVKLL